MEAKGRALFVVGAHRSGTSALTRVLSLAGAALPADLMDATPHNPSGYWEPLPVADLNARMLTVCGNSWKTPFPPVRDEANGRALDGFAEEACDLIRRQYGEQPLIVFKEPRATLLADFWCAAMRSAGYEPCVIVMVRDPEEVAASLTRRDGLARNHGLLLWANYMACGELLTRRMRRAFCSYDELLRDPGGLLARLEAELDVDLPARAGAQAEIDLFLRADLRHHHAAPRNAIEPDFERVWRLHARLHALAAGQADGPDAARDVERWLDRKRAVFGPIFDAYDVVVEQVCRQDWAVAQARTRASRITTLLQASQADLAMLQFALAEADDGVRSPGEAAPSGEAIQAPRDPVRFDPARYLLFNPDVAERGIDPIEHYRAFGLQEGRCF